MCYSYNKTIRPNFNYPAHSIKMYNIDPAVSYAQIIQGQKWRFYATFLKTQKNIFKKKTVASILLYCSIEIMINIGS